MPEAHAFWAVIAMTALVDAAWLWLTGIKLHVGFFFAIGLAALIGINQLYTRIRPRERIAAISLIFAQISAFTAAVAVLTYLAAATRFPLMDHVFSEADGVLGFDWLSFFSWVKSHAVINIALETAYASSIVQVVVLLFMLNALEKEDQAYEFVWLYAITLLLIVPLSMIFPAAGAFAGHGMSAYYLPDFNALRDGTMSTIDLTKVTGIVQFPSFHAALSLILIVSSRGTFLFPVFVPLNVLTIVSAMPSGGHYLSDIIAGLAIVPVAAWILAL